MRTLEKHLFDCCGGTPIHDLILHKAVEQRWHSLHDRRETSNVLNDNARPAAQADESLTRRSPRLCVLADTYYPMVGGGETHCRQLCAALAGSGIPVFVVTRRYSRELDAREVIDGVTVYRVRPSAMKRWGKYLMMFPAFLRLMRMHHDYDVIYVSVFRALGILGVMTAKLLGKKCVLRAGVSGEMSGATLLGEDRSRWSLSHILLALFLPVRNAVLRRADYFVSISEEVREDFLAAGVPDDRIVHIPNAVDTGKFHPVSRERKYRLRKALGLPDGRLFCYTGKLNRGKGLELVVRVWPQVVKRHPDACMVFVGGGANQYLSFESSLREEVRKSGLEDRIVFTGYVANVADYLMSCDFFLFPSESEGMPNALLEAASCGLPVVATRIGGNTDIINDDTLGYLVPVGDERALLEGITTLLQEPDRAAAMGQALRRRIEEEFAIGKMHAAYAALFMGAATGRA